MWEKLLLERIPGRGEWGGESEVSRWRRPNAGAGHAKGAARGRSLGK